MIISHRNSGAAKINALMNQVKVVLQGIVNVSPDSFSDGGLFCDSFAATHQAQKLVNAGAHIVDVGGVSTRPGAQEVSAADELQRVMPILRSLRSVLPSSTLISLDTSSPIVAQAAAEENLIDVINDVHASKRSDTLQHSESQQTTAHIAAHFDLGLILMHMQGTPTSMQSNPTYKDCLAEVCEFLDERLKFAKTCGVNWLALDPGIGFGKTLENNLSLLSSDGMRELIALGAPVLIGLSRKSFLVKLAEKQGTLPKFESTVAERTWRDQQSALWESSCIERGARIIRTHTVKTFR